MSRKTPHAAFVEEYDEDAHAILPDTRQVANVTAKRSKSDLKLQRLAREPFVEAASDSGYSSRTAATANSTQSAPSGRKSPVLLKVDTSQGRADLEKARSKTKDRPRDRSAHPSRDAKMHAGPYSAGYSPAHAQRSPSRDQRIERSYPGNYPGSYWDPDQGPYHTTTPIEPRQREYRYHSSQASSAYDYPPSSPQTARYPPSTVVQVSRSSRPAARMARSNSYHANRPSSFHSGMAPPMNGMMYSQSPLGRYEHRPPLSSSAYANTPAYPPAPPSLYSQHSPYYPFPDAMGPPELQERSLSRPRERPRERRPSIFEPPPIDYDTSEDEEDEEEEDDLDENLEPTPPPPPPGPIRQARPRLPSHSAHDRGEEDYYRSMPPPPVKHRAAPQIIQKRPELPRKSATTPSVISERRPSRSLDLTDLRDHLPEYGYQRSSRETVIPERNRSLRQNRRPSVTYHDSRESTRRIAVENSTRRRRPSIYDYAVADELEKERDAEEYQASQSGKSETVQVPLTADALMTKTGSQRAGSDSGSHKSRSASSRGSDARTQSGSGVLTTTRPDDDNNIVMTMNGVTMSFTQESVGGKRISVRTGQTGAVELNIEGKRPKKYLTGGSEYTTTTTASRKADRKSNRASRRSSQSIYNGRY
ncbi:uncharacterized protein BJX67DRAFT_261622 [Aspergillus lucknowensis]|uniref:Uncharacterized protein n=1 Tax=Aspergillus lucknowensis TaxID=176173 RepID=A0ABR4LJ47_9EURO